MTSWPYDGPLKGVTASVRDDLRTAVRRLYLYEPFNARDVFDALVQKVEVELAVENAMVDDLALKLAKDLIGYLGLEEALWLLGQRADRAAHNSESKFRSLLDCALLAEQSGDLDIFRVFKDRLGNEAELSDHPVKKLVANVVQAMLLFKQNKLDEVASSLEDVKTRLGLEEVSEERESNEFYLIVTYDRVAFLCRHLGDKESFHYYHRKALNFVQRREWDLGLQMELETNLLRALKTSGRREELQIYVASLLEKIERSLPHVDKFELCFGTKVLRDAYNDVSVACSFLEVEEEQLLKIGADLFELWEERYGSGHHEVIFVASQLAYNFETFGMEEEADRYLKMVEDALETFPETTKLIMQAKAKTLIHLWKVHRSRGRLDEAEYYCREELRVNRKHGISQQYVANALRNLAFLCRDQDRREEGLNYLKECLELSREHSPSLTSFHMKVDNEIKKF